jgi:surface polysaccharide O-acyltransferase-like enzyme
MGIIKKIPFEEIIIYIFAPLAIMAVIYFLFPSFYLRLEEQSKEMIQNISLVEGQLTNWVFNGFGSLNSFSRENPATWDIVFWIITIITYFITAKVIKKVFEDKKRTDCFRMLDLRKSI